MSDQQSRIDLQQMAIDSGFDPDYLARLPTWEIQNLLKNVPKPRIVEVEDDAKTIIDIPLDQSTSDQKIARLEKLSTNAKILKDGIFKNREIYEKHVGIWDADDVLKLKQEIDYASHCLKLVNIEYQHLKAQLSQSSQKLEFYRQNVGSLVDISGNLASHFQQKIMNLEHQLQKVNQFQ